MNIPRNRPPFRVWLKRLKVYSVPLRGRYWPIIRGGVGALSFNPMGSNVTFSLSDCFDSLTRAMIWRILTREKRKPFQAAVPDDVRVYAIGDIHGRADLLQQMHQMILEDASKKGASLQNVIIYLGDYVDRGLESRDVIELLLGDPLPNFETIHLRGNHEELFLSFLEDPAKGPSWFGLGGDATVYSYGVRVSQDIPPDARFTQIREELRAAVPKLYLDLRSSLQRTYEAGDYFFVHAGIRPGMPLHEQSPNERGGIR